MPPKRPLSPPPSSPPTTTPEIHRSPPLHDRSSRFQALYSPTLPPSHLQRLPELRTATHRITAWRFPSTQPPLPSQQQQQKKRFDTGHDDDGETHGGRTLEAVLAEKNITGVVVVARWYGGRMLGPVRFEHIKNCARDAIAKSLSPSSTTQQGGKKAKIMVGVAVEEKRREELLRILPERDRSLVVLRGLLAEKKGGGGVGVGGGAGERGDGRNTVEYGTMSVGMLEALERTRDRSLGWVLGEIEKVEKAEGVDEGDGGGDAGRGGEGVAGGRKGGEGVEAEVGRQEPAPAPYDDETESLEDAEESLLLDLENESFDYNHI